MKIGLSWLTQIQGSPEDETAGESIDPASGGRSLGGWVAQQFRQMVPQISTAYHTEHNDNDTHKTITATGTISERGRATAMGDWIDVPYASATFTDSGGAAWTVSAADYVLCQYMLVGSTFFFQVKLVTTSVVGGATQLNMTLAGNFTLNTTQFGTYHYIDNGTHGIGLWSSVTDGTGVQIQFSKMDYTTNWAAAVNTTEIRASGAFELFLAR